MRSCTPFYSSPGPLERLRAHHLDRSLAPVLLLAALGLAALGCSEDTQAPSSPDAAPAGPALTPAVAATANSWLTQADMWGTERIGAAVAVVPNAAGQSVLFAIGGRTATGSTLSRVMAYNAATNSWALRAPLPLPLKQTNGAGVIGGKIYVAGGRVSADDKSYSPRLFVYDPAADTWAVKRAMPTNGLNGLTVVIDDRLYVVTSCQDGDECAAPFKWLLRYDPNGDTWTELATPTADLHYLHRAVGGTINRKIYVGAAGSSALAVYDPVTGTWTTKATAVTLLYDAASAVLGAKLYMIGGGRPNPDGTATQVRTTKVYDPGTNTWTTRAPLPASRSGASAARVIVGGRARLELVGGSRPGNNLQYVP